MDFQLPTIHIEADNLPQAWENSVLAVWNDGAGVRTQYDQPGDPESRDASVMIAIADPFAEPRIHRAMPAGISDLEVYRQEVVNGIHDHWINPEEGKWQYTYHERMRSYTVPDRSEPIDQLQYVIDTLSDVSYSRRAQAVIWKVWEDAGIDDPACLQRLWFRIFDDALVLNAHIRSNDAFKAAFMNMYAFTDIQRKVAEAISERMDRQIRVGQYTHFADSFHIYGSYFDEFEGFLDSIEQRSWEQRTYRTEDIQPLIDEARQRISESDDIAPGAE